MPWLKSEGAIDDNAAYNNEHGAMNERSQFRQYRSRAQYIPMNVCLSVDSGVKDGI